MGRMWSLILKIAWILVNINRSCLFLFSSWTTNKKFATKNTAQGQKEQEYEEWYSWVSINRNNSSTIRFLFNDIYQNSIWFSWHKPRLKIHKIIHNCFVFEYLLLSGCLCATWQDKYEEFNNFVAVNLNKS